MANQTNIAEGFCPRSTADYLNNDIAHDFDKRCQWHMPVFSAHCNRLRGLCQMPLEEGEHVCVARLHGPSHLSWNQEVEEVESGHGSPHFCRNMGSIDVAAENDLPPLQIITQTSM